TLPFDSEATIRGAAEIAARVGRIDGVASVAPVLGAQLYPVAGEGVRAPIFATGVDPRAQMLYRLVEGREPGAGEVVVSEPLARQEGLRSGAEIRLTVEPGSSLGGPQFARTHRVSGVAEFLYDAADQRSLALPLQELQAATSQVDQVSLFGVAAAAGVDPDALAVRIARAAPEISVSSTSTLLLETNRRLSYFRQLAAILGSVALVVTALLVSTIITIGVRERFGEIATLRAIGVAQKRILLGIVVQGMALAGAGCMLGLPLGLWMAGRLDRILLAFPGLPANLTFFGFDAERIAASIAVVVAVGALSGVIPGVAAVRTPLAAALRQEAE
ncbi:MAG: FtsX-like permease family protein, partial [Gemmatimonadota bacterium]|nr:FtsX-like permease family protein [Gemmatimonadota bacterium]